MMKRALRKEIIRSIWKTKNRFLSIMAIVAIGTGFFAGIKSSCPDMLLTAETYFQESNLADFHLVSTFGFNEEDLSALQKQEGIRGIMPGYSVDVFADTEDGSNPIVKLISLPAHREDDDASYLNRPILKEGRLPEKPGECVIERTLHTPDTYQIGNVISFHPDKDTQLEEILARNEFTVVGVVESPSYVTNERGNSSIGDGVVDTFVIILEDDFCAEVYTDVYLSLEETHLKSPFEEEYHESVDIYADKLKTLAEERSLCRYEEVVEEAQDKISDAKQELADGIETQQKELADARQKIADAQQELREGEQEYQDGIKEFDEKIADAQKELEDAELELEDGWKQYENGMDDYVDGRAEYYEGLEKFEKERPKAEAQLEEYRTQAEELRKEIREAEETVGAGRELLASVEESTAADEPIRGEVLQDASNLAPELGVLLEQYNQLVENPSGQEQELQEIKGLIEQSLNAVSNQLDHAQEQLVPAQEGLKKLEEGIRAGEAQLFEAQSDLEDAARRLEEAQKELEDAKEKIQNGEQELKDGWNEFYEEKARGEQELADARQEIAEGKVKLLDAQKDYEEGETESNAEISDAKKEIEDAEKELADLELPKWYVWDRDNNVGYSNLYDDAKKVDAIATVFPVFFIMVAALVCLTTMTRMVEEERTQIGTLKALGYQKSDIMVKYLIYAVSASLLGSAVGLSVGFQLFPRIILNTYRTMYILPSPMTPFHLDYALGCVIVSMLCTGLSAFTVCQKELLCCPAQLMRPRAPKAGKRVFLDRIPWIWNRMSFIHKVTLRNVFRYKRRVLMTVVGIAGCTALMLTGFGLKYAIGAIVPKQYGEVFLYDGITALEDVSADEKGRAIEQIDSTSGIEESLPVLQKSMDVTNGKSVKNAALFVPQTEKKLDSYIALRNRKTKQALELSENKVIINEKLANMMDWEIGDTLTLLGTDGRPTQAEIGGVTENYTFNYVYMHPSLYQELFREQPDYNMVLFQMAEEEVESGLSEELLKIDHILGVSYAREGNEKFVNMISSLDAIVWVLIASAGLLAFVVLYNLSNININERIRELATIKVLGFYDREVSAYIYRESNISSVLGLAVGLILGIFLEKFVIATAEVDQVMFASDIPIHCFVYAGLLTLAFTWMVNGILYFKLKKIDMVESMKSVE